MNTPWFLPGLSGPTNKPNPLRPSPSPTTKQPTSLCYPLYYLGHPVQAQSVAQLAPQQAMSSVYHQPQHSSPGLLGPAPAIYPSQPTSLPNAFSIMTLPDPTWNMDTGDNNCTIEFNAFGFFVKDFLTRHILLQCDSSSDLYPVTKLTTIPSAFVSTNSSKWHQRLGHPGD
ncbi:hypothetical protein Tco_1175968 [Tanacetum coccineum]